MPSYFFHIKIDLTRAAPNIERLLQTDRKLLTHSRRAVLATTEGIPNTNSFFTSAGPSVQKIHDDVSSYEAPNNLQQLAHDWRAGTIHYESVNMLSVPTLESQKTSASPGGNIRTGLSSNYPGLATKARFEPSDKSEDELGYGVVRLFRDTEETAGLYDLLSSAKPTKHVKRHVSKNSGFTGESVQDKSVTFKNEDCTTLCILTIPTWWDVAKLIAFLGEEARDNVNHFRMIRTETAGRYMLLMKFRDGKVAREWRKEWNGKVFDPAAPTEYCQVVFVRSVEIRELNDGMDSHESHITDPFIDHEDTNKSKQLPSIASLGSKPMPPPTRPLQEMPTCPVCLERMDDSSGLLTIPCQHTFHCICLVKWQKNGCPVCRFTQDDIVRRDSDLDEQEGMNECCICRSDINLWICLICGSVGCGRYDGAHAYLHWKQTGHSFSLDMTDQSIWDYASDGYVHRIMQNKLDGKMMELPSASGNYDNQAGEDDVIPKAKLDAMGAEYTQLLMSQLESQRTYYEQKLGIAADKASQATRTANQASDAVTKVVEELSLLQANHNTLVNETIPSMERDRQRTDRRATKFEEMSRLMEKAWREEKTVAEGLLQRNGHLQTQIEKQNEEMASLNDQITELKDTNRDLMGFVSGQEKLRQLADPDVESGTLYVINSKKKDNDEDKTGKKKRRKAKQRGKGGRGEALAILGKDQAETSEVEPHSASFSEAEDDFPSRDKSKGKGKEIEEVSREEP